MCREPGVEGGAVAGWSRLTVRLNSWVSCETYAASTALNDTESNVRICVAWIWSALAELRASDALDNASDDSVLHLAAE